MRTAISANEILICREQLQTIRQTLAWYSLVEKFRMKVMIDTLGEIVNWIADQPEQRSCGCAAHTDHSSN